MTLRELELVLYDKSVSDTEFFKILLQHNKKQDIEDRKSKKDICSIDSPEFKKRKKETNRWRKLINKVRPAIREMMRQHVSEQHEHCCGSESKK